MSRKHSKDASEDSSSSDVEDIAVQIEKIIKAQPNLQDKLQLIALNGYMQEKIKLDETEVDETERVEVKYHKLLEPILAKINEIVEGTRALTQEDFIGVDHVLTEQEKAVQKDYLAPSKFENYWFKALENSSTAGPEIHPNDVPILKHLYRLEASKSDDATILTVKFYFTDNEWFSNNCLVKEFLLDKNGSAKKTYGDAIDWKEGKNVTVKSVKKKQKNKKTGEKKVSVKEVKEESFFHFFKAINVEELEEQDDDDEQENEDAVLAQLQYDIAEEIYDPIVIRSLEAYIGGSLGDDYFDVEPADKEDEQEEQEVKTNSKKPTQTKRKGSHKKSDKSKSKEQKETKQKSKSKSKDAKHNKPEQKQQPKQERKKESKKEDTKDPTSQAMKEQCKQQ